MDIRFTLKTRVADLVPYTGFFQIDNKRLKVEFKKEKTNNADTSEYQHDDVEFQFDRSVLNDFLE